VSQSDPPAGSAARTDDPVPESYEAPEDWGPDDLGAGNWRPQDWGQQDWSAEEGAPDEGVRGPEAEVTGAPGTRDLSAAPGADVADAPEGAAAYLAGPDDLVPPDADAFDYGEYEAGEYEAGDYEAGEYGAGEYGPSDYEADRAPRRHRLALIGVAVAAVVVIAGALGFVHVSNDINPGGTLGATVSVKVPPGSSTSRIAGLLAKAGVIHGSTVFTVYAKLEGAGPLIAGTYHLAKNEPYSRALAALEAGPVVVSEDLVVPEGFTIRQMAAALGRLKAVGMSPHSFVVAATSGQVRSPYEPAGTTDLEGLLFPATYPVQQGEQPDDLVQYMVDTFDYNAAQLGLSAAAARLHYTPYQVVTVASIVEREAKFTQDRGLIASVIYNRLAAGMPIGAESTLLYALGEPKGNIDITQANPYNTLVNKGLPPTPISNPGMPSLEAASHPPKTDYLYWVEINPDGKMGYASTEAGFRQLQRECRVVHLC
jgi:UPF0755 protein